MSSVWHTAGAKMAEMNRNTILKNYQIRSRRFRRDLIILSAGSPSLSVLCFHCLVFLAYKLLFCAGSLCYWDHVTENMGISLVKSWNLLFSVLKYLCVSCVGESRLWVFPKNPPIAPRCLKHRANDPIVGMLCYIRFFTGAEIFSKMP